MLTMIANHLHKFPLKRPKPDPKNTHIAAAVLVVLHGQDDDPQVILTQRAFHLKSHAGEVAFPGGMWDQIDEDLMQTALREAQEEIGLAADSVTLLATMPTSSPRRRDISVTPFVAVADSILELNPDDGEIEAIFNAPLRNPISYSPPHQQKLHLYHIYPPLPLLHWVPYQMHSHYQYKAPLI